MSIRQPVRRAAKRAFRPSRPIASDSWSSGTTTVACFDSSSTSTSRTRAGDSALAMKRAGSSLNGMMSIFSPRSSETTMRTREPRGPTQAPTGSTPGPGGTPRIFGPRPDAGADRIDAGGVRNDRDLRAVARLARDVGDLDEAVGDLRDLELEQLA